MKKQLLKGIAKMAEKAVQEASGSKSCVFYYEVEMPKVLKNQKK